MELPESFIIQQVRKEDMKNDKQPTHRIKRAGDWVEIGACWRKVDKMGNPFLSCRASKPRPDFKKEEQQTQDNFDQI